MAQEIKRESSSELMRDSFQLCTPDTPTKSSTKVNSVPDTSMDLQIRTEDIISGCGGCLVFSSVVAAAIDFLQR